MVQQKILCSLWCLIYLCRKAMASKVEVKKTTKSVAEESTESNGIMAAWSTGLAEVPFSFIFSLWPCSGGISLRKQTDSLS